MEGKINMNLNEISKDHLFCDGWEFSKNPIDTEYSSDLKWTRVYIPHDWMIYETRNLYETSTGWYRKAEWFFSPTTFFTIKPFWKM